MRATCHWTRQAKETSSTTRKAQLDDFGLRVNPKKTQYMECDPQTNDTIELDGEELRKTDRFKYLGALISNDNEALPDAEVRANAA